MGLPSWLPLPWLPFLRSVISTVLVVLSILLWAEGLVLDLAPARVRSRVIYAGLAVLALSMARQVFHSLNAGPTPDKEVSVESGIFRAGSVTWVAAGMRGWRPQMEDAHVVAMLDGEVFPDSIIFAVLDGHGGKEVSALASRLLTKEVEQRSRTSKQGSSPDLEDALARALPSLDARLRDGLWGLGHILPAPLHPFAAVGSTACVAVVDFARREVLVANIGDSRAMLIRNGKAIALSEDHKPENPKERRRIVEAGGEVKKVGPCHRVDGNLNLSRALGDFNLKSNFELPPEKQKVSAFPDITRTPFVGGHEELLLVACDGLFERCSNQDIADLVWPRYRQGVPLRQISKDVLLACCARGCGGQPMEPGTDNESVILVTLPAAEAVAAEGEALSAGQRVAVHGLESEAGRELNGQTGVLEGGSKADGRYDVRLHNGDMKSLKAANLQPVDSPKAPSGGGGGAP